MAIVAAVALPATAASPKSADAQAKIESAMSAAPPSISSRATIKDWPAKQGGKMTTLREGDSEWTCLPDIPDTAGNDPMCLDKQWMAWADAWMNKKDFQADEMGFGYMLQGGSPESNVDPYATEPTAENEWIENPVPHLMVLVPNEETLEGLPTDPSSGGPWVMWRDTPYVHIMAPMPQYQNPR
ncbi:hypothetical protein F6455_02505 [Proteobacteria bacterium 005FR1]|nr:hypothetical protein [Proteobacteria bacterium 005FR1]